MERMYIIFALFALNAAYWGHLSITWNKTSDDGVIGRSTLGVIILIASIVIMFNLGYILNHNVS
jgi:hypothetical protein